MSEFWFPVAGVLAVLLVAAPALTLLSRLVCALCPPESLDRCARPWHFGLIVGPSLGPVLWLTSAAVHQVEEGRSSATCVVDHLGSELCHDVLLFGVGLLAVLAAGVLRLVTARDALVAPGDDLASARVRALCEAWPTLHDVAARVRVVGQGAAPACTRGLLWPRIELEQGLVGRLDDDELRAVLLHEREHLVARDPLRLFVAQVALSIHPGGRWLVPELARHSFAREAACDRAAVARGACPVALAQSLVAAARPAAPPGFVAALGGAGVDGVRVRVQLLLGYAVAGLPTPSRDVTRLPVGLTTAAALALAVGPHVLGTGPLDLLHQATEQAALLLGLG